MRPALALHDALGVRRLLQREQLGEVSPQLLGDFGPGAGSERCRDRLIEEHVHAVAQGPGRVSLMGQRVRRDHDGIESIPRSQLGEARLDVGFELARDRCSLGRKEQPLGFERQPAQRLFNRLTLTCEVHDAGQRQAVVVNLLGDPRQVGAPGMGPQADQAYGANRS
jgi:hypothetical protein